MYSFFARRRTAVFVLTASATILTACNGGSSVLTPSHGLAPTASPSAAPSMTPVASATPTPTAAASATPHPSPTATPTATATATPTAQPSATPTARPSATPTPTATPMAVASASTIGMSRVDGSNPADMDINASMGATLPSGDTVGFTYFIGSTNATGTSPTSTTYFFLSNPGSFPVTGTAVAAAQTVFNDTPSILAFAPDRVSELFFTYNIVNEAQPIIAANTNFTCTIFDGRTLIGSATTVLGAPTTSGGVTNGFVDCTGVFPNNNYGPSANGHAYVNLPATYNDGDVYTYIVSH